MGGPSRLRLVKVAQDASQVVSDAAQKVRDKVQNLLRRFQTNRPSSPVILSRNAKTDKSAKIGYLTATVHLSPERESVPFGGANMCPMASRGCAGGCLVHAGMHNIPTHRCKRIGLTLILLRMQDVFLTRIKAEIRAFVKRCKRLELKAAIRVNALSDQRWLGQHLATWAREWGLDVTFYDYTKLSPKPGKDGYYLTFSLSEKNLETALLAIQNGMNVAVVFDVASPEDMPETFLGLPVINGDEHDAIFIHGAGRQCVVGLTLKGTNRAQNWARQTGFAINPNDPAQMAQYERITQ